MATTQTKRRFFLLEKLADYRILIEYSVLKRFVSKKFACEILEDRLFYLFFSGHFLRKKKTFVLKT